MFLVSEAFLWCSRLFGLVGPIEIQLNGLANLLLPQTKSRRQERERESLTENRYGYERTILFSYRMYNKATNLYNYHYQHISLSTTFPNQSRLNNP